MVFYFYVSNSHICYVIHGLVVSVSVFWLRAEVIAQAQTCCYARPQLRSYVFILRSERGVAFTIDTVDFLGVVLGTSIEGLFWSDCRGKIQTKQTTKSFDLQFSSRSIALSSKFQ